jgi:hypothetical protein
VIDGVVVVGMRSMKLNAVRGGHAGVYPSAVQAAARGLRQPAPRGELGAFVHRYRFLASHVVALPRQLRLTAPATAVYLRAWSKDVASGANRQQFEPFIAQTRRGPVASMPALHIPHDKLLGGGLFASLSARASVDSN